MLDDLALSLQTVKLRPFARGLAFAQYAEEFFQLCDVLPRHLPADLQVNKPIEGKAQGGFDLPQRVIRARHGSPGP